ncbi:MAG: terminase family protein [Puniceicoccales bacterium]|jgi:phage FluMu gp28-like protein|nr:terminase family protein [Puniceicoccales bacterium]
MRTMAGSFFLPYQSRWICDTSRLKILEKSRQIGMSWATAYRLVRSHVCSCQRLDSWVSSRDEQQARLFTADCQLFGTFFEAAARAQNMQVLAKGSPATDLRFANGTAIHSLSSHPDAQAGKRGNRILDEFALHPDPRQLYSIAVPGITWGGQLEILSTHRGSLNFFHQLVQEVRFGGNPKKFSLHRVTLQDALEQGFLRKLRTKLPADDPRHALDEARYFDFVRTSCPDEATFQQEYMCQPLDDRGAFLPVDLIAACEFSPTEFWEISLPYHPGTVAIAGPCTLGVDIGREHDLTVFWLLEMVGDVAVTRRVECLAECPFSEQERILSLFLRIPRLTGVCIDQSGLGRQFVEQAVEKFGRHRVRGVTFTPAVKEAMAYAVRRAFEGRGVRIPASDAIRADLHSVRREFTAAGNLRFLATAGRGGHADRFWALALAIHAAASGGHGMPSHAPFQVLERNFREILI